METEFGLSMESYHPYVKKLNKWLRSQFKILTFYVSQFDAIALLHPHAMQYLPNPESDIYVHGPNQWGSQYM